MIKSCMESIFVMFGIRIFLLYLTLVSLACCGLSEFNYRNTCPQRRANGLGGSCRPYDELIFISLSYKECLTTNSSDHCINVNALVGSSDENKLSDDCSCFGEPYFIVKREQGLYWCSVGEDFIAGTSDDICFDGLIRIEN